MASSFNTTNWSLVLAAKQADDPARRAALAELCRIYWFPLFAFVRRRTGNPDDAMDLTQGFFSHLLDGNPLHAVDPAAGSFRNFLLASIKNYHSHERERATAQKRGGGAPLLSLDAERDTAEARYKIDPGHERTPETLFEYHWALTVLDQASQRLQAEFVEAGRQREYKALSPFLTTSGQQRSYRDIAEELESTEGAVKMAVRRMRQRYGALLREQIAQSMGDPQSVDRELRYLLGVIREF